MSPSLLLDIAGHELSVAVRRSATASRMSLRVAPGGGVVVVLPAGVPLAEAEHFVRHQGDWIAARLAAMPEGVPLTPGAELPFMGIPHVIAHQPAARRGVWAEEGRINVSGREEHVARRVGSFLRDEARLVLAHRSRTLAETIGRKVARVTVRDTRSRWGSCTAAGELSFSWRLILAPTWILDYVVAHEVGHLAEMNHGPEFWRLVETLAGDPKPARAWLRRHGPTLHRYGLSA
ncbi:MAG: M48 family peptidase [Magnetospirillum sp.]|nr:MAG: M48 family peptidase [Magnetospirillum sp.]